MIVSTTNDISGYRVTRHLGLVRGITVRSRSVVGNFFGGIQTIFGGKLSVYVNLAEATRQAVAVWSQGGALGFTIKEPAQRANSITCVAVSGHQPKAILDYAREKCGVVLGVGLGDLGSKAFRIAHMGHTNAPMVIGTLAAVEMALAALRIPHGRGGVQAAVDYLAAEVPV
mgnify:CR=1 FL=1